MSAILSVVWVKARRNLDHFEHTKKVWVENGPPTPVGYYIGSGGHTTNDLQKAQVYGFSRAAKKKLEVYLKDPTCYEVRPVIIQEVKI